MCPNSRALVIEPENLITVGLGITLSSRNSEKKVISHGPTDLEAHLQAKKSYMDSTKCRTNRHLSDPLKIRPSSRRIRF